MSHAPRASLTREVPNRQLLDQTQSAGPNGRRSYVVSRSSYGFVVDSVNVSVLLYVPVRSGSVAPIDCLSAIVTGSLDVGPV